MFVCLAKDSVPRSSLAQVLPRRTSLHALKRDVALGVSKHEHDKSVSGAQMVSPTRTFRLAKRQPLNCEEHQTPSLAVLVVLCCVSDDIVYALTAGDTFEDHGMF